MSKPELPSWYTAVIAAQGAAVAEGRTSRPEAIEVITAAITARPEHVAELVTASAARELRRWLDGHGSSGDLIQASLFPDLPVRMRVTPKESVEVARMTAAQLDNAKAMLWAQTGNVLDGAEAKRAAFLRLYDQVRPLMAGAQTVRDVLPQIAGKAA